MARERRGKQGTRGQFLLGRSYGEPGPGLGTLYEAWRMEDGRPVLLLRPSGDVEWRPEGPWRIHISCDPTRDDAVALSVEQSPPKALLSDLVNLVVLMGSSVERVEDDDRVQTHLASQPTDAPAFEEPRVDWRWSRTALAGIAVFALGLGVGRSMLSAHPAKADGALDVDSQTLSQMNAPSRLGTEVPDAGIIAYALPIKPFADQAVAPCRRWEVEINGGCWVELAQRPPCEKDVHAEHQGKCYMPAVKRARSPQAVEPSGP